MLMLASWVLLFIATILRTKLCMANRYQRKDVLAMLYGMVSAFCDKVFTSNRPVATDKMDSFLVIRLSQGVYPYADTHNTAYVQVHCFVRDRQGGVENVGEMERLIDGVVSLVPFNNSLMSCNDTPLVLETKSDGMGFYCTVIQFKLVINV